MSKVYAVFSTAAMLALSLSVAACGKSNSTASPTSPTTSTPSARPAAGPAPAPGGPTSGGASITGTVVAGSTTGSVSSLRPLSVGMTVSIVGTSMTTSVDGAGGFSFRNVPHGDDVLAFQGPGVNAQLPIAGVADQEDIHMMVVVNGSTATLDAGERDMPGDGVEIEGRITQVTAAPPTLMIGTTTVSVPAGTTVKNGSTLTTFSALSVGERVEVHAANIGGTITATSINVDSENPPPVAGTPTPTPNPGDGEDNGDNNGEAQGTLSAKAGTCPSIAFMVSSTKKSTTASTAVSTNASTKFEDAACSALANGDSVEVKGTRQTDGSILASHVQKDGKAN